MRHPIVTAIDAAVEAEQATSGGHRPHLGASQIGSKCERKLVYSFRHAVDKGFPGRMLRLFKRGHLAENRFIGMLREVGFEVREHSQRLILSPDGRYAVASWDDPVPAGCFDVSGDSAHVEVAEQYGVKLRQWQFKDLDGHFAGSNDGISVWPGDRASPFADIPTGVPFLNEYKTYNTRGFTELVRTAEAKQGVDVVKDYRPLHYVQMQTYMAKFNLPFALYGAINKNDDDLYFEVVRFAPEVAVAAQEKAARVVGARTLPPRISNSAAWHECKFCDFRGPCHLGEPMVRKCRTCCQSVAAANETWFCSKWSASIPLDVQAKGCDAWSPITD